MNVNKLPDNWMNKIHKPISIKEQQRLQQKQTIEKLKSQKYLPCRVCRGEIINIIQYRNTKLIGGPPATPYTNSQYCTNCGIKYHAAVKIEDEKGE